MSFELGDCIFKLVTNVYNNNGIDGWNIERHEIDDVVVYICNEFKYTIT